MGDLEGDLEDDLENLTGDLDSSRGFFVEAGPDFEEAGPAFDFLTEAGPGFRLDLGSKELDLLLEASAFLCSSFSE